MEVKHPSEINEIFDGVSYAKGASLLRMLRCYIGAGLFDAAIVAYIHKYQFANAATADLWACISAVSDLDIGSLMRNWTSQSGFPILRITEISAENDEYKSAPSTLVDLTGNIPSFAQSGHELLDAVEPTMHRFFFIHQRSTSGPKEWVVPVHVLTGDGLFGSFLMQSKDLVVIIPTTSADTWVKFNAGQTGFFRVDYVSPHLLSNLVAGIKRMEIGAADRLGLVSDVFATSSMGLTRDVAPLELLDGFVNEDANYVWSELSANLRSLLYRSCLQPYEHQLKEYIAVRTKPTVQRIGWQVQSGESSDVSSLRATLVSLLVSCDDADAVQECRRQFFDISADTPADLRLLILQTGVRHGGVAEYERALDLYRTSENPEEKRNALQALCKTAGKNFKEQLSLCRVLISFLVPELQRRTLEFAFSDEVRPSDITFAVGTSLNETNGVELTWQFFEDKFDVIQERYSTGQSFILTGIIETMTYGKVASLHTALCLVVSPRPRHAETRACNSRSAVLRRAPSALCSPDHLPDH